MIRPRIMILRAFEKTPAGRQGPKHSQITTSIITTKMMVAGNILTSSFEEDEEPEEGLVAEGGVNWVLEGSWKEVGKFVDVDEVDDEGCMDEVEVEVGGAGEGEGEATASCSGT
jgi:hypothetical protein